MGDELTFNQFEIVVLLDHDQPGPTSDLPESFIAAAEARGLRCGGSFATGFCLRRPDGTCTAEDVQALLDWAGARSLPAISSDPRDAWSLVDEPTVSWERVAGSLPVIKKLNALFTERFVPTQGVPSDECEDYAMKAWLLYVNDRDRFESRLHWLLRRQFATTHTRDRKVERVNPELEPQIVEAVQDARRLLDDDAAERG